MIRPALRLSLPWVVLLGWAAALWLGVDGAIVPAAGFALFTAAQAVSCRERYHRRTRRTPHGPHAA